RMCHSENMLRNGMTAFTLLACAAFAATGRAEADKKEGGSMSLTITSPAFTHEGEIPAKYTCEGSNVSPPLEWTGAPPNTKSFALIVDDPDAPDPKAPKRTWVHWVLYDVPVTAKGLPEG